MSTELFTIVRLRRLSDSEDEILSVAALADDHVIAVGLAQRLIDHLGGYWRYDGARKLWQEYDRVGVHEKPSMVKINCYPRNKLP